MTALITRYADASGKIPPQKGQALRDEARALVQGYFVTERRATAEERAAESAHLRGLITAAQKELRGATDRQRVEIAGRINLLASRLNALERRGVVYESIDSDGRGVSPYARALMRRITAVVSGVVDTHRAMVRRVLDEK